MPKRITAALVTFVLVSLPIQGADPDQEKEIIPLAVGNKWEFKVTTRKDKTITLFSQVLAEEEHDGKKWFQYADLIEDPKKLSETDSVFYVRSAEDGQHELAFEDDDGVNKEKVKDQYLYFAYPVKEVPHVVEWPFGEVTTVSRDELITVPAGIFSCYHYQIRNYDGPVVNGEKAVTKNPGIEFWLAPGVGMVKWKSNELEFDNELAELVSYELSDEKKKRAKKAQ